MFFGEYLALNSNLEFLIIFSGNCLGFRVFAPSKFSGAQLDENLVEGRPYLNLPLPRSVVYEQYRCRESFPKDDEYFIAML